MPDWEDILKFSLLKMLSDNGITMSDLLEIFHTMPPGITSGFLNFLDSGYSMTQAHFHLMINQFSKIAHLLICFNQVILEQKFFLVHSCSVFHYCAVYAHYIGIFAYSVLFSTS